MVRRLFTPGIPSHPEETEGPIIFDGTNNRRPRRRAGTEDSVDSTSTHTSSSRQCLADALKDSGDFHFDMSDRWRIALMESLDQPMFPEPQPGRGSRLRNGVTNFVKKRAQGLRRDHLHQPPQSPLSMA